MDYQYAKEVLKELLDAFDRDELVDYFYDHAHEVCEAAILAHGSLCDSERNAPKEAVVKGWRIFCPVCGKQQKSGKAAPWYCERCGQMLERVWR